MILIQIGLGLEMTDWIISCVTSASFSVLRNGEPTTFFESGRGLKQGCPLSMLLFILVMEGLSILLKDKKLEGKLSGVKVSRIIKILHVLFVDDVVIMSKAGAQEWWQIDKLLKSLCSSSGWMINISKSTML
jgi:hypothetical protein